MSALKPIHKEILNILRERSSTYALPITSEEIGTLLHVTPAHIRRQLGNLVDRGIVEVRRGPGGGYYLRKGYAGEGE